MAILEVLLVVVAVSIVLMYIILKRIITDHRTEYSFESQPSLLNILVKVILVIHRKQGKLYPNDSSARDTPTSTIRTIGANHEDRVTIKGYRINRKSLEAYIKICCPLFSNPIPICYLESLFMKHMVLLATKGTCRVSPIGLIHINQTITQHQSLDHLVNTGFATQATIEEYRVVDRGIEALIALRVVDENELIVWEGTVTVLSRNPKAQRSGRAKNETKMASGTELPKLGETVVKVPGDMGVQYAHVTGDWNPHHLYPWSARLLGYRAPIAHGMWTLARTLDEVLNNDAVPKKYPMTVNCAFKRPLFMPGTACVQYGQDPNSDQRDVFWFRCVEQDTGVPHLIGTLNIGNS